MDNFNDKNFNGKTYQYLIDIFWRRKNKKSLYHSVGSNDRIY